MNILVPILAFFPLWLFRSNLETGDMLLMLVLLFVLPVLLSTKILNSRVAWSVTLFKTKVDFKTLFMALLLTLSLDQNLGLWGLASAFGLSAMLTFILGAGLLAILFLLITASLILSRRNTLKVLVIGVLAIIGTNLIFGEKNVSELDGPNFVFDKTPKEAASKSKAKNGGPTVVIILDEMLGIEGIDIDLPNGPEAYESSRALYKDFGFKAYGSAYSLYSYTLWSIPAALNFVVNADDVSNMSGDSPTFGYKHLQQENKLFDQFSDGQIEIFQTYFLNFCQHRSVIRCNTFTSFEPPTQKIENFDSGLLSQLVANYRFNTNSVTGHFLQKFLLETEVIDGLDFPHHDKAAFENNLNKLQGRILASQRGGLFFAHYMVPHDPYGFDEDCKYRLGTRRLLGKGIAERSAQHNLEINCVNRFLRKFFEGLESAGVLDVMTLVVLSDHGSRIGMTNDLVSKRDKLVAGFSSLFAVRAPGVQPGYDTELHSTQYLFSKYLNANHSEHVEKHEVFVGTMPGKRLPVPNFARKKSR